MRTTTCQTHENRTITVDFRDEATSLQLLGTGKAFVECVLAFRLSLGFQHTHKASPKIRRNLLRQAVFPLLIIGCGDNQKTWVK